MIVPWKGGTTKRTRWMKVAGRQARDGGGAILVLVLSTPSQRELNHKFPRPQHGLDILVNSSCRGRDSRGYSPDTIGCACPPQTKDYVVSLLASRKPDSLRAYFIELTPLHSVTRHISHLVAGQVNIRIDLFKNSISSNRLPS